MQTQEFLIDYVTKEYLDFHFRDRKNRPYFQLGVGDIGGTRTFFGEPNEEPSYCHRVFARPEN